jgi:hypothetical protein
MKKTAKRLNMSRETLKLLSSDAMTRANGGTLFGVQPVLNAPPPVLAPIVAPMQSLTCGGQCYTALCFG